MKIKLEKKTKTLILYHKESIYFVTIHEQKYWNYLGWNPPKSNPYYHKKWILWTPFLTIEQRTH